MLTLATTHPLLGISPLRRLAAPAVVVCAAGPPQLLDDVGEDEVALVVCVELLAVVVQDLLDLLDLGQHLEALGRVDVGAVPYYQGELDARALRVVGVLDAGVGVLDLVVGQLVDHGLERLAARLLQAHLLAGRARRDEQPLGLVLVAADRLVGGEELGGVDAGHCVGAGVLDADVGLVDLYRILFDG